MNILIITQHFPPEKGAVRRLFEFARYFVRQGHKVSVLTAIPNYPDGIVPEEYKGHFFHKEDMDGVTVYRSYVLPAANRNPGKRMIGFLIFSLTAIFNSTRIKDKFDVIVASSPPVTTPVIGWAISKLRRSKLFIEIRDAQPESSEEFGNLRPSLFTRTIKKVIHAIYHSADGIITVTEGLHKFAVKSGVPEKRVTTVKSGVGNEFFDVGTNGIRKRFGWENDFLVLRAGTMGWAHSFEVMVEAARQLTDQPNIRFVFVGDGEKRTIVQEMVRDYGLKNITLVGSQPLETIPYFLRASNVLVECLRDVKKADPVTRGTFPAKLFEYMASGRPIIFGGNKGVEAVEELEKAGGALFFKSDDPKRLSELILALRDGQINGDDLGRRYRDHADRFLRREIWADRYLSYLSSV